MKAGNGWQTDVTVGHDQCMILCSHIRLHTLAILCAPFGQPHRSSIENGIEHLGLPMVDVCTGTIAANETDGLDGGMVTNSVHRGTAPMDNVQNTRRKTWSR